MDKNYEGVHARFLRPEERFALSEETEMPLVLEAEAQTDLPFLHAFLKKHAHSILSDLAQYGAILLRGFEVHSDEAFEQAIINIQGFEGISEVLMSEEGRTHVGPLKFVLHTNAIYKTGGTLFLGGFHNENYYAPDVPEYICFCCLEAPRLGGETGLINMEKIYQALPEPLKQRLEKQALFVSKWLITEVAERYQLPPADIEKMATSFDLPICGEGKDKFILMYKPNVLEHPLTKKRALFTNLFELTTLDWALRRCFMNDYQGKTWFWHRFVWRMPAFIFEVASVSYMVGASILYSPKHALRVARAKWRLYWASKKLAQLKTVDQTRVESCFNPTEVAQLAQLIRRFYSSCLWQAGDILLVDNRKVAHAGMPGAGTRKIRALIGNPISMKYGPTEPGCIPCKPRKGGTIGSRLL